MVTVKPNSMAVYEYVKAHSGEKITASDIAEATGLNVKVVNGIVTQAFQKKSYMVRTAGERENADGTHKSVKFISLTPEGLAETFAVEE